MNHQEPLGSKENPIKCDGPAGEIQYLRRLSGPNHEPLVFERMGSISVKGNPNYLDLTKARSLFDNDISYEIYLDMYHSGHQEQRPVYDLQIMSNEELEDITQLAESQGDDLDSIIRVTNAMKSKK